MANPSASQHLIFQSISCAWNEKTILITRVERICEGGCEWTPYCQALNSQSCNMTAAFSCVTVTLSPSSHAILKRLELKHPLNLWDHKGLWMLHLSCKTSGPAGLVQCSCHGYGGFLSCSCSGASPNRHVADTEGYVKLTVCRCCTCKKRKRA